MVSCPESSSSPENRCSKEKRMERFLLGLFFGFTWCGVIPGIPSNDPSLSLVPVRDHELGYPTWNAAGGDGLCTALPCWLSQDIARTYKMDEIRTTFSTGNLRWAIQRHWSGRNLHTQTGQVCIQPSDLTTSGSVSYVHVGKCMLSLFQRLVWKKENLLFLISSRKSFNLKSCWERLQQAISQLTQSRREDNPRHSFPCYLFFFMRDSSQAAGYQISYVVDKESCFTSKFLTQLFSTGESVFPVWME